MAIIQGIEFGFNIGSLSKKQEFSYAHMNLQKHIHKVFIILDIQSRNTKYAKESCLSTDLLQMPWRRFILLEIIFQHVIF